MTKPCLLCLSLVGLAHFLIDARTLTSHGAMDLSYNHVPWFPYNKPIYSTHPTYAPKASWYPIIGPYTYGPPTASPPAGFHQQQIVHIHDVGPPDLPHGDNYQEGVDYNIHNVISNIETPLDDLTGVASSRVETRKQKPKTRIKPTTASSRRRSTSKSSNRSKTQKRGDKIQQSRDNKTRRRKPETIRTTTKNNSKERPSRLSYEQKKKVQRRSSQRRSSPQRRRTRPTRRTYSRNPSYDYRDYDDFYANGQRRRYKDYDNYDVYNDYELSSEEDLARQDDATTDYDNDDNSEPTTTEAATTAETTTTVSTTEAPETTTGEDMTTTESTTMMFNTNPPSGGYDYHFDGYGPSNGNENISITYAPELHGRADFDNYWYLHQGSPEPAHYQNYFLNSGILK